MRKPYATLLCLLISTALWAQPDSANLHYRQGRMEAKVELLEEKIKEQEKNFNEKLAYEIEKHHNALAERLEVKNENLQFKMTEVNWLIAIFGIIIPAFLVLYGRSKFKEYEEKAKEHLKTLDGYVAEGKSKCDSISEYSSEPTKENKAKNIEKAQEVQKDKNASPLAIDEGKANVFYFSEKYQKAIDKFESILTKYNDELTKPQLKDIYFRMAYSYNELNKKEKALELYNTILTLSPNYAAAWNNKGSLLQHMGKEHFPTALQCYNKAIELKFDNAEAWYNKGKLLHEIDNDHFSEALQCYNKAIELKPDLAVGWYNKGNLLSGMGNENFPEARLCYDRAIELKPDYADAWNNKGILLKNMGKEYFPEALQCYDKAIELKPDYTDAHFNKGVLLELMGASNEKILACFEQALRHNPNLEQAKLNIKRIEDKMKGKQV